MKNNILNLFSNLNYFSEDLTKFASIFDFLPVAIYCKDKNKRYLNRNHYAAQEMVFLELEPEVNIDYVKMKTDFDLFDKKTAEQFQENDNYILKTPNKTLHFVEELTLPSGSKIEHISVKRCLLDDNSEPIAILGCSINLNKFSQPHKSLYEIVNDHAINKFRRLIMQFMGTQSCQLLNEIIETLTYLIHLNPNNIELKKLLLLTEREIQSLCFLLKGYSAKQIASKLKISPRTIEIYIAHIKEKLNLPFKLEIIDWFWLVLSKLE